MQDRKAVPEDQSLGGQIELYTSRKEKHGNAGQISAGRVRATKIHLAVFQDWHGKDSPVAEIDEKVLDGFHGRLLDKVAAKTWSGSTASPDGRRHCWLWLTKRPQRMAEFSAWLDTQDVPWPTNLWAGTTVTAADKTFRIDELLKVGDEKTIRFLSVEPQLEPLDLRPWLPQLDWIIQGGESGRQPRKFDIAWAQEMHRDCQASGTPYFLKQLGAYTFRGQARVRLNDRHGADWSEWPDDAPRVRQMPHHVSLATSRSKNQILNQPNLAISSVDALTRSKLVFTTAEQGR